MIFKTKNICGQSMKTLETICADSLLNKLGDKPDLIQIIVGKRAIKRLEKTVRKYERERAERNLKNHVLNEIDILVQAFIGDIIRFGMGNHSVFFMTSTYKDADPSIVEKAWNIAKNAVRTVNDERFNQFEV